MGEGHRLTAQQEWKHIVKLGLEFEQAKEIKAQKKSEVAKAKLKLRAVESRVSPLQELSKELITRRNKREKNYKKAQDEVKDWRTAIRDGREAVNQVEAETKGIKDEMQRLKREEKRRLEKIAALKARKEHYERVLQEPQEDVRDKVKEKQQERVSFLLAITLTSRMLSVNVFAQPKISCWNCGRNGTR